VALKVKGNASDVSLLGGACVLRRDGAVVCWGSNYFGSLGRGTFGAPGGDSPFDGNADFVSNLSSVVQVSAGLHACAIKADNSLWCWGLANYGQLGNDCSSAPCRSEEGPFSPLPLEVLGFKAKAVAVGSLSTCAIDSNDSAYCWGSNDSGQLGNGEVSAGMNPTPTRVLWK
jgi:alpha-tubulin suppressor-like RCC1 family protein